MTRIGRFVAGVGAVTLGVLVTVGWSLLGEALVSDASSAITVAWSVLAFVVFGTTAAAFFTWCVDAPFVRPRR